MDDFMKKYPTEDEPMSAPSTSFDLPKPQPTLPTSQMSHHQHHMHSPFTIKTEPMTQNQLNHNLIQGSQNLLHTLNAVNAVNAVNAGLDLNTVSLTQTLASTIAAGLNTGTPSNLINLCNK